MAKKPINPTGHGTAGPYSPGIEIDSWVYVSGQGPLDFKTGKVVSGTIEEETRLTLQHVGEVLKAAGCTFDDVVKCTCHLVDIRDFDRFNSVYREIFKAPYPARTTVQSMLGGGMKVEIDCIAKKG